MQEGVPWRYPNEEFIKHSHGLQKLVISFFWFSLQRRHRRFNVQISMFVCIRWNSLRQFFFTARYTSFCQSSFPFLLFPGVFYMENWERTTPSVCDGNSLEQSGDIKKSGDTITTARFSKFPFTKYTPVNLGLQL